MHDSQADGIQPVSLSRSEAKILRFLCTHRKSTNKHIENALDCPRRTVYEACRSLKQKNMLEAKVSLKDTRQKYWIPTSLGLHVGQWVST